MSSVRYKSRRYQSLLEARWAVFFDTLKIPYQYEPPGIDIKGAWYFPAFYLPEHMYYVDIKAQAPTPEEDRQAMRLRRVRDKEIFVFWGEVKHPSFNDLFPDNLEIKGAYGAWSYVPDRGIPCFCWIECPYCHQYDISLFGCLWTHFARACSYQYEVNKLNKHSEIIRYLFDFKGLESFKVFSIPPSERLLKAYESAQIATFETVSP